MKMARALSAFCGVVLSCYGLAAPALAQNTDTYFGTPGGSGVNGLLGMCLNASAKAVPCSDPSAISSPTTNNPSSAASAAVPYSASGGSLVTSKTLKASAGNLYSFEVAGDSTLSSAAWSVFIFDSASASGTVAKCFNTPSGTTTYTGAFPTPIAFATGITVAPSTTICPTYTASASHAFISGDAK